jgi:hypothetical protein
VNNNQIAILAISGTIVGPLLLAVITAWLSRIARRADKKEDYARQDAVAAKLKKEQQQVAAQAAQAAKLLLAANERVAAQTAATATVTNGKLDQIHELVNSTLTGAMQSQLVAIEAQLAMIRRFQPGETAEISTLEEQVAELRARLADRAAQTVIADAAITKQDTERPTS